MQTITGHAVFGQQDRTDLHEAAKKIRRRKRPAAGAIKILDECLNQKRQAEGHDQAEKRLLAIELSDERHFEQDAKHCAQDRDQQQAPPAEHGHQSYGQIGSHCKNRAMGKINDAQHPEKD
ncbi:hypothetical protein SAMN05216228_105017 [Rhizobium tibeticum]|uniref:Uncharacterized protein n=1 Tax=Rhizobium tibeticum TaxID=501024 RepID=A0A1H8W007_9HYPH|nr:hypothetical protein RTCCBAU85039_6305 [Rhizobium tibeticum]SEP20966.1 hypothetical protein SAMN05216228_105017 [Rhizobium tibeticum]